MIKTWISLQFFLCEFTFPTFSGDFPNLVYPELSRLSMYDMFTYIWLTCMEHIIIFATDWSSYGVGVCCFLGVYDQTSKTITSVHPPDAGWPCGSSIKFGGIHWSNHDRWPLKKESKGVVSKMCLFTPDFWGKWSNSTVAYFFNGFSTTNR